jgi:hypothetical protein
MDGGGLLIVRTMSRTGANREVKFDANASEECFKL